LQHFCRKMNSVKYKSILLIGGYGSHYPSYKLHHISRPFWPCILPHVSYRWGLAKYAQRSASTICQLSPAVRTVSLAFDVWPSDLLNCSCPDGLELSVADSLRDPTCSFDGFQRDRGNSSFLRLLRRIRGFTVTCCVKLQLTLTMRLSLATVVTVACANSFDVECRT